jgi:hypothetical protein
MTTDTTAIIDSAENFLTFMKTRSQMFHRSNVFFRDFHYGILAYAEQKGKKISYGKAEVLAWSVVQSLESAGTIKLIKPGSWMLNYPAFRKPSLKSEVVAKSSSGMAAAKPAVAAPSPGSSLPVSTGGSTAA